MDDSETPTYNLQIEPQVGCHPGDGVESTVTCLPSASDENENQLDGDGHELLTSSDSAMGKPEAFEPDSLNNNESCTSSCEVAAGENLENTACEGPKDGQAFLRKDQKIPGKSSRSKKGTVKKIPQGIFKKLFILLFKNKVFPSHTVCIVLLLAFLLLIYSRASSVIAHTDTSVWYAVHVTYVSIVFHYMGVP